MYTHIDMYVCRYVQKFVCVYAYMRVYIYIYIHIYIYMHVQVSLIFQAKCVFFPGNALPRGGPASRSLHRCSAGLRRERHAFNG